MLYEHTHQHGYHKEPRSVADASQSACSVDRIDSALATVLPLVPGLSYFRFCCEDPRCGIELDEIDPEQWALLEVVLSLSSLFPGQIPHADYLGHFSPSEAVLLQDV